ncbi:hypothetical protein [Providencia alcalifaciens]|uniref:hypothetical protein n=1 Tax=Providencia alcalifaciens TaxID=126385 RepID=UPI0012B5E7F9|nr:hypothetical protein [Providencia alcalifaciens]MTC15790.1 hypothetical protein [Providencia alcalifaciens]
MKKIKKCIFCNQQVSNKSKEHVIPQWLINMTGDPKRAACFGIEFIDRKIEKPKESFSTERESYLDALKSDGANVFAFKDFTFPACTTCNNSYADMESKCQKIFVKLLGDNAITKEEIVILLDWFDKVRVGLWLGMLMLKKNPLEIEANFGITKRIAQCDRVLVIEKTANESIGTSFFGVEFINFMIQPSVFMLRVNNLFFYNASTAYLVSKQLGFSYIDKVQLLPSGPSMPEGAVCYSLTKGTGNISIPIIPENINGNCTTIYQPIYDSGLTFDLDEENETSLDVLNSYTTEYMRSNSLANRHSEGDIFIQKGREIYKFKDNDELSIPYEIISFQPFASYIDIINFQKYVRDMNDDITDYSLLEPEHVSFLKERKECAEKQVEPYFEHARKSIQDLFSKNMLNKKVIIAESSLNRDIERCYINDRILHRKF